MIFLYNDSRFSNHPSPARIEIKLKFYIQQLMNMYEKRISVNLEKSLRHTCVVYYTSYKYKLTIEPTSLYMAI